MTSIVTANISYYHKAAEGYVVYNIEVSFRGSNWTIEKRYNDFVVLHQGLEREFRDRDLGALPKRRFFNRFEPKFLEERNLALRAFLTQALVKIPLTSSQSMLDFLEVTQNVDMEKQVAEADRVSERAGIMKDLLDKQWCADLLQDFTDRMIDSQSVKIEPRDDAEVAERRTKLLQACNGFKDHEEHLKKFFNPPKIASMSVNEALDMCNTPLEMSTKEQHRLFSCVEEAMDKHMTLKLPDGRSLVTHMDAI